MKVPFKGAIDCDIHPAPPGVNTLVPYLNDYWREQFLNRHIERMPFVLTSAPPNAPASVRQDWRSRSGPAAATLDAIRREALDPFGTRFAVCNVLHGAIALYNADMSAALCSGLNDWIAKELLDREPRLRASIVVATQDPALAAAEIERVAADRRFVQVLMLVMGDRLLGNRANWPIYQAAEKHGLAIGVHAGSTYRYAPTATGWPSFRVEDYVANATVAENQIMSLLAEGAFNRFPNLTFVFAETGFTWLPSLLWRSNKSWRGVRPEVPWIDRAPSDIVRERVRFTLQPVDAPDAGALVRTLEHIGSDRVLLFSTDYPHWQFEGENAVPDGLSEAMLRRILVDNPLETYPRLNQAVPIGDNARKETVP
jgi:predicted TIM-barrel fold metal-dependent hydrolase